VRGRQPYDSGWRSECGARGQGLVTFALGRFGHQPAGTMTGVRGARCNRDRRQAGYPRRFSVTGLAKHGPSCALGTTTPFGQSRGGTPEDVRTLGCVPRPARLRRLRNSVLRRSASFLSFSSFVARIERNEIRGRAKSLNAAPGFRFTQPGLRLRYQAPTVMNPVTTTGSV
jgi:hypothetical protein